MLLLEPVMIENVQKQEKLGGLSILICTQHDLKQLQIHGLKTVCLRSWSVK